MVDDRGAISEVHQYWRGSCRSRNPNGQIQHQKRRAFCQSAGDSRWLSITKSQSTTPRHVPRVCCNSVCYEPIAFIAHQHHHNTQVQKHSTTSKQHSRHRHSKTYFHRTFISNSLLQEQQSGPKRPHSSLATSSAFTQQIRRRELLKHRSTQECVIQRNATKRSKDGRRARVRANRLHSRAFAKSASERARRSK